MNNPIKKWTRGPVVALMPADMDARDDAFCEHVKHMPEDPQWKLMYWLKKLTPYEVHGFALAWDHNKSSEWVDIFYKVIQRRCIKKLKEENKRLRESIEELVHDLAQLKISHGTLCQHLTALGHTELIPRTAEDHRREVEAGADTE